MNLLNQIISALTSLGFTGPVIIEIINGLLARAPHLQQEWTAEKVKALVDGYKARDEADGAHFLPPTD